MERLERDNDNKVVSDIQWLLHVIWNAVDEKDSKSAVMVCNIYIYGLGKI